MKNKKTFRFSVILLFLAFFTMSAYADVIQQKDTVTGIVIDKDKQPLPGAKVEIEGQPYSAFTDLDGRFNIKYEPGAKKVLVTYPKTKPAKKKISPDMIIQVGRNWRQAPDHYQWFVGANIGIGLTAADFNFAYTDPDSHYQYEYTDGFIAPTISVMAGRVKVVGWYVKAFASPSIKGIDREIPNNHYYNMGAILGGMVRLGSPIHLYLGGGFAYSDFTEIPNYLINHYNWQIDLGLLFRIKDHFGFNISVNCGTNIRYNYINASFLNYGASYFF